MIGDREASTWAEAFGVAKEQVRRDHLVSWVLAALPQLEADDPPVFIGGTALARTHLDGLRLSEDIDLLVDNVAGIAERFEHVLPRLVRRSYPSLSIGPRIIAPRGLKLHVATPDVEVVELQLIRREPAEATLPLEQRPIALRYEGLPRDVTLRVPTRDSFVAMKFGAYRERFEPRDLFDLAHLADLGAITPTAGELLRHLTGAPPQIAEVRRLPRHTAETWRDRLAHQTRELMTAEEALARVRLAVEAIDTNSELGD